MKPASIRFSVALARTNCLTVPTGRHNRMRARSGDCDNRRLRRRESAFCTPRYERLPIRGGDRPVVCLSCTRCGLCRFGDRRRHPCEKRDSRHAPDGSNCKFHFRPPVFQEKRSYRLLVSFEGGPRIAWTMVRLGELLLPASPVGSTPLSSSVRRATAVSSHLCDSFFLVLPEVYHVQVAGVSGHSSFVSISEGARQAPRFVVVHSNTPSRVWPRS
jgi:hypothetical protein